MLQHSTAISARRRAADWEVAAAYDGRGNRRMYPWGDTPDPDADHAIFTDAQGNRLGAAAPVGVCAAGVAACGAVDMAGNVSRAWTTSFLLVYREFLDPDSLNFRLIGSELSLGGGSSSASNHRLHSTIGQVIDSAPMSSSAYRLASGYESNRPLPSSPPQARTMAQSTPVLQSTAPVTDTCSMPRLAINDGAAATNDTSVTLHICAARAQQIMLSNEPTLSDGQWESVELTRTWDITPDTDLSLSPAVFAAFRYADGTVLQTMYDDILYDTTPPTGQVAVDPSGPRTLALTAQDEGSGVAEVQISSDATFSGAVWQPYTTTMQLEPVADNAATTQYVRFRDMAGNVSDPVSIVLDKQPPTGSIELVPSKLGPTQDFATVNLTAQDNVDDGIDMRVSEAITFAEDAWQPFTPTVTLPISPTDEGWGVIYVQYRDQAGNESVIYGAVYGIDTSLPEITSAWLTPGKTLTRTLTVQADDLLSGVAALHLSNDPMMLEGMVTHPYTETVTWTLDEREVVWVQVEDGVGNRSLLYPATVQTNDAQRIYLPLVTR
ncbi:formylglycine-generating enzyme family protein [bacterium]|nr:formylglycine-generating enzyme family protein [bacterium]